MSRCGIFFRNTDTPGSPMPGCSPGKWSCIRWPNNRSSSPGHRLRPSPNVLERHQVPGLMQRPHDVEAKAIAFELCRGVLGRAEHIRPAQLIKVLCSSVLSNSPSPRNTTFAARGSKAGLAPPGQMQRFTQWLFALPTASQWRALPLETTGTIRATHPRPTVLPSITSTSVSKARHASSILA